MVVSSAGHFAELVLSEAHLLTVVKDTGDVGHLAVHGVQLPRSEVTGSGGNYSASDFASW